MGQLARGQVEKDRAAALTREMDLREKRADVEDQLAQRQALLADLDTRVKELIARQARLDAAASQRLADAVGVDIDSINGSAAQIALVKETMKYLGIPYVWGGASPSGGFDCSGLVMYVYAKFGVSFLHGATLQARQGTPVPLSRCSPPTSSSSAIPASTATSASTSATASSSRLPTPATWSRSASSTAAAARWPAGTPSAALTARPGRTVAVRARRGRLRPCLGTHCSSSRSPVSRSSSAPWPASPSRGRRLAKHGMAVSRRITPLADGLTRRADAATTAAAERLAGDGESLTVSISKLQVSLARLQVVTATINEAMEPFYLLTGWLAGDKGYNDWRRWSRAHPR